MKSVTLIAPKSKNVSSSDISVLTTPLSGILILATMLHKKGYFVKCFDESFKIPNYEHINSDIILVTAMSATVNRAYELADCFRRRGKKVYIGGVHVSNNPEEALLHCDKVIVGEGENIIFDLVEGKLKEKIVKGSYVLNLDSIPLPDYGLINGISKNPDVVSLCSSRGCPFNCKFCSLKKIFGKKFRSISTKKIVDYLTSFKKIKTLCFDEPNFTVDKKRAIDILTQMKENKIFPKYAIPSVSLDVAENEKILRLCSDVSKFTFLIGLESINQKSLDSYNKKQTLDDIKKSIKKLHDFGIAIQGSFIFGSDYDDKSVFQKTVDFCQETDIEFPIFCALTPYVGTETRDELEKSGRIFTNNWDYYDGAHVVISPKNMTPLELQEGLISSYENFYSKSKVLHHLKKAEIFYGLETFYVRSLFKKIIKENKDYLEYLEKISS